MGSDSNLKEYISETHWVSFRLGHAGDASQIASCFQKRKQGETDSASVPPPEDTSLEISLVDGLGGGDSPPSVFALLADIISDNEASPQLLGAAALLSSGWEDSCRALRVEFFYVIEDAKYSDVAGVLERRMWLRLSSLAIMTSNQLIITEALSHYSVWSTMFQVR